ncbi:hypothetical protein BDW67DRAFT_87380 [Aspergillus spinulosporus]
MSVRCWFWFLLWSAIRFPASWLIRSIDELNDTPTCMDYLVLRDQSSYTYGSHLKHTVFATNSCPFRSNALEDLGLG